MVGELLTKDEVIEWFSGLNDAIEQIGADAVDATFTIDYVPTRDRYIVGEVTLTAK